MGPVTLADIQVTPLRRIATAGGDVLHAIKRTDPGFVGFGEAYFSWVHAGSVKAWKRHHRMTLNLVVPVGLVRFAFTLEPAAAVFREFDIGEDHYARVTVPPGIWFGFHGLRSASLVLNAASIPHDPDEVDRLPPEAIPFTWSHE